MVRRQSIELKRGLFLHFYPDIHESLSHTEDHDPLPSGFPGKQIPAVDLIQEEQVFRCHEAGDIFIGRVVEKEQDLPGADIPALPHPFDDLLEDLHGEGIEEITAVHCFRNLPAFRLLPVEIRFSAGYSMVLIREGGPVDPFVKLYTYAPASTLPGEIESGPPFAASVVHKSVLL